jgi:PleD family two-component response regulator
VRREKFAGRDRMAFGVTFSAGVVLACPGESLEGCVARADNLLYQAKSTGRNRVLMDAELRAAAFMPASMS